MKRVWMLVGALVMSVTMVGCARILREGLVEATVGDVETAATKVMNIKNKIDDAVKKTETGKTPDFKDALLEVDALKRIAKEMQEFKIKADALKDKTTEEERKDLSDKIKPRSSAPLTASARRKRSSTRPWRRSKLSTKMPKTVREKLAEADGEFEVISRQR